MRLLRTYATVFLYFHLFSTDIIILVNLDQNSHQKPRKTLFLSCKYDIVSLNKSALGNEFLLTDDKVKGEMIL